MERIQVCGGSGSGKTTLARLLAQRSRLLYGQFPTLDALRHVRTVHLRSAAEVASFIDALPAVRVRANRRLES